MREHVEVVRTWVEDTDGFRPFLHDAGAVCFPGYDLPLGSMELAERLRTGRDTLIVPGAHFEMGKYVRIGFGIPRPELEEALGRLGELVREL